LTDYTEGPWAQGRVLMTSTTIRWTAEQIAAENEREHRGVYAHFSPSDEGRSRVLVATCRRPDDAVLCAAAPTMHQALLLAKRLFNEALPKFNWAASALDANAIDLLNQVPRAVQEALEKAQGL